MRRHIALNGFMGAGKTTIGKKLARRLGVNFFDLDALVVAEHGPISDIFQDEGQATFRTYEFEALTKLIEMQQPGVIALGGGAVTYAPTLGLVKEKTYSVWLYLTLEETIARVRAARGVRPLLGPNPEPARIAELYNGRLEVYRQSDLTVKVGSRSAGRVAAAIVEALPKTVL